MAALVKTPLTRAMEEGTILRLEELTRMGSDTQDTLITVLSEKTLPIPELDTSIEAKRGFNVIATANNRDKGVNELSSALKRRFNVVVLPSPATLEEEKGIVVKRVGEIGTGLKLPPIKPPDQELARIVTLFRELRDGKTLNGKTKLKTSSGSLSTAEAISVGVSAWAEAAHFGRGTVEAAHMAANLVGAVVKDPVQDLVALQEYLENVVRSRDGWDDLYRAIREVI
jgi:MoxR-like ATPase